MAVGHPDPWAWGWDAVAALGTALAFVLAVLLWRADRAIARRDQARRVAAHLRHAETSTHEHAAAEIVVHNGSDVPVFTVSVQRVADDAEPLTRDVLLSGEKYIVDADPALIPVFANDDGAVRVSFGLDGRRWVLEPGGRLHRNGPLRRFMRGRRRGW